MFFLQDNFQTAANEFRGALDGDLEPRWVESWSHIALGRIFSITNQKDRAVHEYKQVLILPDRLTDAESEATRLLKEINADIPLRLFPAGSDKVTEPATAIPAEYSGEARNAELEGTVLIDAMVSDGGLAHDSKVTRPLGLGLDENALNSVRSALFTADQVNRNASGRTAIAVDFFLPLKLSRWHLTGVIFDPPPGASRPEFVKTVYPPPAGIVFLPEVRERGSVLAAIGRPATAVVGFDIDEQGRPSNIQVQTASDPMWGSQATDIVKEWRFKPGTKDGKPLPVPCSIELMWGPRKLSATVASQFSQFRGLATTSRIDQPTVK